MMATVSAYVSDETLETSFMRRGIITNMAIPNRYSILMILFIRIGYNHCNLKSIK